MYLFSSKRCSPTRIRHAIATELAGNDQEKLETVSRIFMKNRPNTTAKFYVINYQQREAVRLSMKLYEKTRGTFDPTKVPQPNPVCKEEEQNWLKHQKAIIKTTFYQNYEDPHLTKSIAEETGEISLKVNSLRF